MRPEAVTPTLLEILRALMAIEELNAFSVGGGTSLALRFGHRKSVDIDLFTVSHFDSEVLLNCLRSRFLETKIFNRTAGSLCLGISGVKVDILHHAYGELESPFQEDGIRFISLADIAAMKVNAVTNRGSKKDFSDLLLLHFQGLELKNALDFFCRKYGDSGRFLAIRSLQFFEDAAKEPDPVYINGWTWDVVESEFKKLARGVL